MKTFIVASSPLTQVNKTHHHVGIVEKVGVVRRGERGALAQQRGRAVRLRHPGVAGVLWAVVTFPGVPLSPGTEALPRDPLHALLLFLLQRHGVVQVEHEERRGRRLFPGCEGPRTVRQAQDGEDLPLDLPAFVVAQPPVNKTGVHMVVTHPALGARQKAQAAPRQSEDGAAQRCKRCHLDKHFKLNYIARFGKQCDRLYLLQLKIIPVPFFFFFDRSRTTSVTVVALFVYLAARAPVRLAEKSAPVRKSSSSVCSSGLHPKSARTPSIYGDMTPSLTLILCDAQTRSYAQTVEV